MAWLSWYQYSRREGDFPANISPAPPPVWNSGNGFGGWAPGYEEIREDRHPVIILCGRDLAQILIRKGLNSGGKVHEWLANEFPVQ